jgi:hypothetical protein
MKTHRVIVQVHRPRDDYPGMVEEWWYRYEDQTVMLCDHAGIPTRDRQGNVYEKKLAAGEDPHVIAGRLTKERWHDRGGDKRSFSAPIHYPDLGIV